MMANPFLEKTVEHLVISSSRVGASFLEALKAGSDNLFSFRIFSTITELQETQYWVQVLLDKQPNHLQLNGLKKELRDLNRMLNEMVAEPVAV